MSPHDPLGWIVLATLRACVVVEGEYGLMKPATTRPSMMSLMNSETTWPGAIETSATQTMVSSTTRPPALVHLILAEKKTQEMLHRNPWVTSHILFWEAKGKGARNSKENQYPNLLCSTRRKF